MDYETCRKLKECGLSQRGDNNGYISPPNHNPFELVMTTDEYGDEIMTAPHVESFYVPFLHELLPLLPIRLKSWPKTELINDAHFSLHRLVSREPAWRACYEGETNEGFLEELNFVSENPKVAVAQILISLKENGKEWQTP